MLGTRIRVLALLPVIAFRVEAQSYTCAGATDESTAGLKGYVIRLVTATTDTALVNTRIAYQLSALSASQVSVVTNNNVCRDAALSYHAALNPIGTPPISRTMVVIKVGNNRYVIRDKNERNGEYEINMVTDKDFVVLKSFSS